MILNGVKNLLITLLVATATTLAMFEYVVDHADESRLQPVGLSIFVIGFFVFIYGLYVHSRAKELTNKNKAYLYSPGIAGAMVYIVFLLYAYITL